jgi:hypothetical protein
VDSLPSRHLVQQLVEFLVHRADSIAADIKGLQPRVLEEEVEDKALYFLFRYNGPVIFHSMARSALFSTKFAFLGTRTQRKTQIFDSRELLQAMQEV